MRGSHSEERRAAGGSEECSGAAAFLGRPSSRQQAAGRWVGGERSKDRQRERERDFGSSREWFEPRAKERVREGRKPGRALRGGSVPSPCHSSSSTSPLKLCDLLHIALAGEVGENKAQRDRRLVASGGQ